MAARTPEEGSGNTGAINAPPQPEVNGPSFERDEMFGRDQRPQDLVDEALMESFPCSDPPSYSGGRV